MSDARRPDAAEEPSRADRAAAAAGDAATVAAPRFPGRGPLVAAAWIWFLTGLAHGLGALQERLAGPPPEIATAAAAMRATVFALGALQTDFYNVHLTFSWLFTVFLWITAAGLWFDLKHVVSPAGRRALALRHVVFAAAMNAVCVVFLAPPPLPFGLLIMALGLISWRKQARAAN